MKPTYLTLLALTLSLSAAGLAAGASSGRVISWGMNIGGSADAPRPFVSNWTGVVSIAGQPLRDIVAVAAGSTHALAVRADGTVEGWGYDYYGQGTGFGTGSGHATNGFVRIGGRVLSNVIAVAAGDNFSLALKTDGTVVGWGDNRWGQAAVPADLKGVTAVAAGKCRGLALRGDGTVAQWGGLGVGSSAPPARLSNVVAIAAGGGQFDRNLALKRDGTVVAWGPESDYHDATPPPGLSNVVAIAVGEHHSLALRADGTVVGWGINRDGEATGVPTAGRPWVSSGLVILSGQVLTNVVAVAAGNEYGMAGINSRYSLALRKDGTVVAWGCSDCAATQVPAELTNVTAIAAGQCFSLAIKKE
jgi:alpha-tubulin suppressor-like RCC1 family protein